MTAETPDEVAAIDALESELHKIVSEQTHGNSPDEITVWALLSATIAGLGVTANQSAQWDTKAWARARATHGTTSPLLQPASDDSRWRPISRREVFDLRSGDPFDLFIGAMAWGFGRTGYGAWRTARIIENASPQQVRDSVETIRNEAASGATAAFRAWSRGGDAKVRGLGTAFASKVAYFAAYDLETGTGPLIADLNTAWSFWALTGGWDSRRTAECYAQYVSWAEKQAADLGRRSDDIERALFELGPTIRSIHRHLR